MSLIASVAAGLMAIQGSPQGQPPATGSGVSPQNAVQGTVPAHEKLPSVPNLGSDVRADKALTIDEAAAIAEQNAFAVRTATSNVELGRQRVNELKGGLGPQVSVSAVYTRYPSAQTTQLSPSSPPITIQPLDTKQATVSLNLPIDISGNIHRNIGAAGNNLKASKETLQAQKNQARLQARQAFIAVLRAAAGVTVQQQAIADATENLRIQNVKFDTGVIAKVDVIRAQTQLEQANSDLLNAQDTLQTAKESFNSALARPIETPVTLVEISSLPDVTADPVSLVTAAQANRPEVRALKDSQSALALTRRALEAGQNPSLSLGLSSSRNFDPSGFSAKSTTTLGTLTLNIPIFDSGITRARVKEARQNEEQNRIQLDQTQLNVSLQVRQALTNLVSARARLGSAQQQVALAEENLRIARVRNQEGRGIFLEIVDAETQLTQSRNTLVSARYDYLNAYAQLQLATGTDQINSSSAPAGGAPRGTN